MLAAEPENLLNEGTRYEVFEGDELDILVSSGRNERFYVLGRKSGGGNNVYVMEISC